MVGTLPTGATHLFDDDFFLIILWNKSHYMVMSWESTLVLWKNIQSCELLCHFSSSKFHLLSGLCYEMLLINIWICVWPWIHYGLPIV